MKNIIFVITIFIALFSANSQFLENKNGIPRNLQSYSNYSFCQGGDQDDFSLCNCLYQTCIQTVEDMEGNWTWFSTQILQGINNMTTRIVYTENLIDDMGDQIGVMADRIVNTTKLISAVGQACFDCQENNNSSQQVSFQETRKSSKRSISPLSLLQDPSSAPTPFFKKDRPHPTFLDLDPFEEFSPISMKPIIALMFQAVYYVDNLNGWMIYDADQMLNGIGAFGDKIVNFECKIMNMSLSIGQMADKIVQVESHMAGTAQGCCPASLNIQPLQYTNYANGISNMNGNSSQTDSSYCLNVSDPNNSITNSTGPQPQLDFLGWPDILEIPKLIHDAFQKFNPMQIGLDLVCKVMSEAMLAMYTAFQDSFKLVNNGTAMINQLGDSIISMGSMIQEGANLINGTGQEITDFTDFGLDLLPKACNRVMHPFEGVMERKTSRMEGQLRKLMKLNLRSQIAKMQDEMRKFSQLSEELKKLPQAAKQVQDQTQAYLNSTITDVDFLGIPSALSKDMNMFIKLMSDSMMNGATVMSAFMNSGLTQVSGMVQTVSEIQRMAQEIVTMMGRMQQVADISAELGQGCYNNIIG